jgi:hypothetical protein
VSNPEHNAKTPSAKTGLFATLGAFLRGPGRGAPSAGRHRRPRLLLVFLAALTAAALSFVLAAPALAAGPPIVTGGESEHYTDEYSCGSGVEGPVTHTSVGGFTGCVNPNGLKATWRFEYATSNEGPWTPVSGDEGSISQVEAQEAAEGKRSHDAEIFSEAYPMAESGNFRISSHSEPLTGLSGETSYYFRLAATNSDGSDFGASTSFETELLRPTPEVNNIFNVAATSARVVGYVHPNGSETEMGWRYEYATSKEGPWTAGAEGTISRAEVEASEAAKEGAPKVDAELTGLTPATPYYVRLFAEDEPKPGAHKEATSGEKSFETAGPPTATTFSTHALHGEAIRLLGVVSAHASPVTELQTVTVGGGATGGVFTLCLQAQCTGATATAVRTAGSNQATSISLPTVKGIGDVPGSAAHDPATRSEVTGVTTSAGRFLPHHPISGPGIPPGTEIQGISGNGSTLSLSKETTAAVTGAELTSDGQVFTDGEEVSGQGVPAGTTITNVEYPSDFTATLTLSANATKSSSAALTAALPFGAPPLVVQSALSVLPALEGVSSEEENVPARVELSSDGSYEVELAGALAGENLPLTADSSGLTPSGTVTVATVEAGSRPITHYRFEYEAQEAGSAPFAHPSSTPEEELGEEGVTGSAGEVVGADLPVLVPGETYRFRLTATNTTAGNPVVHGSEQSFTVPVPPSPAAEGPCPNEAFRTGPSANLPDCRAYEQLTPRDKKGAIEPFRQGLQLNNQGAVVGEDGTHLMLSEQFAHWEFGVEAGQSPYFFSRGPEGSWQTTAASLQPETGLDHDVPELESPDLTSFAFSAGWGTGEAESPDLEFKVGFPGSPYVTAASVPRAAAKSLGWVAASEDFSKLILAVTDRGLIPNHSTGTASGADLFEYSGGALRQANVTGASPGTTIGSCGAVIVRGPAEANGESDSEDEMPSGAHAVSADGSRVFFEAVPGSNCSEPKHLYMRVNGAETRDLGTDAFLAANKEGSEVLLANPAGEVVLYDTESATAKPLPGVSAAGLVISEDFNVIYFRGGNGSYLYRYDIAAGTLRLLMETSSAIEASQVSPDGRYVYFSGDVAGVPAGGAPAGKVEKLDGQNPQAFLYDSVENMVECVSCAAPFDPEPAWPAEAALRDSENGHRNTGNRTPHVTMFSANGDYAFFDTIAALVPSDVNGEHEFKLEDGEEKENDGYSNSSDVYEWRRVGVGGCTAVQGCISLISSGREGHLVLLLGTTESGRDVFFTSRSQLGPNDDDNSMDIYDARIGGGEPLLAPRPVECEGDACSTPFAPPSDLTPSSATFQGAADLGATLPEAKPKPKLKPKPGKKAKKKKRARPKKQGRRAGKKAGKSDDRRGR